MPKKIDPTVKERCVRQVLDHLQEYPSLPQQLRLSPGVNGGGAT